IFLKKEMYTFVEAFFIIQTLSAYFVPLKIKSGRCMLVSIKEIKRDEFKNNIIADLIVDCNEDIFAKWWTSNIDDRPGNT
ncbi:MAG: hypothetical protein WCS17_10990, partial [Prevotella sp.]